MSATSNTVPQVYSAIASVMSDLAVEGIKKDNKNTQQNYSFRGIDDVFNALAPILSTHKLLILPRVLSRSEEERESKSGGRIAYVTVHVEFDLISAVDGSKHTISTYGEAMDSADKATNKAMSAAYKYAAFQAFCIPVDGTADADSTTHDVRPGKVQQRKPQEAEVIEIDPRSAVDKQKEREQRLAGDWLRQIKVTKEEFENFKAACALGTRPWEVVAFMAQDEDVSDYDGLIAYLAGKNLQETNGVKK